MFAEVVVNRPMVRRPAVGNEPLRDDAGRLLVHSYRLPERLCEGAAVGQLVQVPLQSSHALGVIVELGEVPQPDVRPEALRDVAEILDPLPVVTPGQIALARWIAGEYLAPLSQAMRLMLPPGLEERTLVVVSRGSTEAATDLEQEGAVLRLLQDHGGRVRLSTLMGQARLKDPEAAIAALAERGVVQVRTALLPPRPAPRRVQYVRLLADEHTIRRALPDLGHASKQADILLALARRAATPVALTELCQRAGCSREPVEVLAQRGWVRITQPRTLLVAVPGLADETTVGLERSPKRAAVLAELRKRGGPVELKTFLSEAGASSATVGELERRGLVHRVTEPSFVFLILPLDQVLDKIVQLRSGEKERAVLEALRDATPGQKAAESAPDKPAGAGGRVWAGGLYAQTGADLSTLQRLAARGLVSLHAEAYDVAGLPQREQSPRLTPEQDAVWQVIKRALVQALRSQSAPAPMPITPEQAPQSSTILLHGVIGSGKTEIYLRAAESALAAGQRAIVLVPEISLTAQTVRRFEVRFPGRVAVLHSQLSMGQRYAVWDQVRRGDVDVLIGPRSALLAPMSRLGLVIVDEAHDAAYKQAEPIPLPSYHACDVAIELGRLTGAVVLLGSATPDLVSTYRARKGTYRLLELPHRAPSAGTPRVASSPPARIIDLRQELRAGNRSIFSRALQKALLQTFEAHEQAILFLNRRGAATFVLCRDCGYVANCPRCDVPLAFHHFGEGSGALPGQPDSSGILICHRCNHRQAAPARCPGCGGRHIRYFGLGTERVEAELRQLFPEVRLLRWDADTAASRDHEQYLTAFAEHRADVLLGTQMLAKGLDLPCAMLVGVISADTALHLPDYHAAERTFQLLTQVTSRAACGERGGQAILQTYQPEHYAIRTAAEHNYAAFYEQELAYRKLLGYPPFKRLVALRYYDVDATTCQVEAERLGRWLAAEIRRLGLPDTLMGPAPCFFGRVQGRYRWQIVVRTPDPEPLLGGVALPWGWYVDVDPVSLL